MSQKNKFELFQKKSEAFIWVLFKSRRASDSAGPVIG